MLATKLPNPICCVHLAPVNLESNQEITSVKPGPGWSNLKLFPRKPPGVPTTTQTLRSLRLFYPPPFLLPSRFVFFHPAQSGCYGGRVVCFCGDPRNLRNHSLHARTTHEGPSCWFSVSSVTSCSNFGNHSCTDFCTFAGHLRCKSTTYDPKLHHTKSPTLNPQHSTATNQHSNGLLNGALFRRLAL